MFECREKIYNSETNSYNYDTSTCGLDGVSDPPIIMIESALDFLANDQVSSNNDSILVFVGDTQAHSYTSGVNADLIDTSPILLTKCIEYIKEYFNSDYVFYTAGNNDGNHDSIFTSNGNKNVSLAWANVLISHGIVTNDLNRIYTINLTNNSKQNEYTTVELFENTGYYIKRIPDNIISDATINNNININTDINTQDELVYYMIILNTNLGLSDYVQNHVFATDLEWILSQNNAYCIVIGHHPGITNAIVPSKYDSIIKGKLSGHVHFFTPTDANGFTILPAVTQYSLYAAVVTGNLTKDEGNVELAWDNVQLYKGDVNTVPQEQCWK